MKISGAAGEGFLYDIKHKESASIRAWVLTCKGQSAAWSQYLVSVVHLREAEGVPAPHRASPDATHELIVLALDPRFPVKSGADELRHLRPINAAVQVSDLLDAEASALCDEIALAIVHGDLPAEPPLSGQGERIFTPAVMAIIERMRGVRPQ